MTCVLWKDRFPLNVAKYQFQTKATIYREHKISTKLSPKKENSMGYTVNTEPWSFKANHTLQIQIQMLILKKNCG